MITAEQLWYITNVYPENIEAEEAKKVFDKSTESSNNKSYWECAAKIINKM